MKFIAIQGIKGCFHNDAVSEYFKKNKYSLKECSSFKEVVFSVFKSDVDLGVIAIENTIAGTILPNYDLLSKYNLKIIGEVYIPIKHCFMVYPGQRMKDIKEIYSHPMAISQCECFINNYNMKISECSDTASAAKYISKYKKKGIAAIASKKAASEYGLKVLYENIQTTDNNFTRFFIISNNIINKNYFDKASLRLKISHTTGSLSKILTLISDLGINMTKIQSIPILQKPWEYFFYIDIVFNNIKNYEIMKKNIKSISCIHNFSIMGEYKNGIMEKNNDNLKKIYK